MDLCGLQRVQERRRLARAAQLLQSGRHLRRPFPPGAVTVLAVEIEGGSEAGGPAVGEGPIERAFVDLGIAQTLPVLGLGNAKIYESALDWALANCRATGFAAAFDFNCKDGDGAWWEGTAQMAAALKQLGRAREAAPLLHALQAAQVHRGAAVGALPAASRCDLTTGFTKTWTSGKTTPWLYSANAHVGATAWFIFATLDANPYHLPKGTYALP